MVNGIVNWQDINKILKDLSLDEDISFNHVYDQIDALIVKVEELEKKVAKLESWRMVDER